MVQLLCPLPAKLPQTIIENTVWKKIEELHYPHFFQQLQLTLKSTPKSMEQVQTNMNLNSMPAPTFHQN